MEKRNDSESFAKQLSTRQEWHVPDFEVMPINETKHSPGPGVDGGDDGTDLNS